MNIAEMTRAHLSAVAQLERRCFSAPWSEAMLTEELGGGIFLVAEHEGEVLGYLGCQTVLDEGYITNVAVQPDCRRHGIGEKLLTQLLLHAQEAGLAFVTLEVRAGNVAAISLYEKAGFVKVGERRGFYRNPHEDAVLMTVYFKNKEVVP